MSACRKRGGCHIEWYVLRTLAGKEESVCSILNEVFPEYKIIYPRRRIFWRKSGQVINLIRPLFEGYLFIETSKIREFEQLLRRTRMNIAWLLYSAGSLVPIFDNERRMIQKIIGNEGIAEVSIIKHNESFEIVDGPLLGLEKIIKKVSRRNLRIMAEVPMFTEKRNIELQGIISD